MTVKEAWVQHHLQGDIGALTGTSYEDMVRLYDLQGLLVPGVNVLEIGVGTGNFIRGACREGCNVYALDICDEAFECVKGVVKGTFLHEKVQALPVNFFDVITSHLVTQHMSDWDILLQFPAVIRSLRTGGVFCVQFAVSDIPEENNNAYDMVGRPGDNQATILGGRMVRTADYARMLVWRCGGKVIFQSGEMFFPEYKSRWYYLRVQKADYVR